eukprot:gene11679-20070_t
MRYAETHKVAGLVLISSCDDDDDPYERAAGYFEKEYGSPWNWAEIRKNATYILQ